MYVEKLRKTSPGVIGSFILKGRKIIESDLKGGPKSVARIVYYLVTAIAERVDIKWFYFIGEKSSLYIHTSNNFIVVVQLAHTANISLIMLVVKRILKDLEKQH